MERDRMEAIRSANAGHYMAPVQPGLACPFRREQIRYHGWMTEFLS
jgi:hypothetical protein